MQAIVFTRYGPPDYLELKEVEKPAPKDNETLVQVVAAATNPLDWHIMRAAPFFVRLDTGLRKPKMNRLGVDIAGRVAAVGSSVTEFQPGDEVFGGVNFGGFAEYAVGTEKSLVHKPAGISFEGAASTPVVGFTAIQGLRDTGNIQTGEKILVNGASGGVGTFAVQYAKSVGAEVTGVCSTRNLDLVRSIGADHVIDYTQEDFTRTGQQYDLIYDAVGNRTAAAYRRALSPDGRCVVAGFTTLRQMILQVMLLGSLITRASSKTIGSMGTAQTQKADLLLIKDLLESGKVVPVIDRSYPLSETAEAIRYLETGRARGKVMVNVTEAAQA
ncbi:MAG: NAD(P)-dependent alcohol dehydrogenase [Chloroflexi bacterium]|nr:NAD(P)-dependent alcohol dehydrogenase [Chloroflexota bacterium]